MSYAPHPRGWVTVPMPRPKDAGQIGKSFSEASILNRCRYSALLPSPSTPSCRKGTFSVCPPGLLAHRLMGVTPPEPTLSFIFILTAPGTGARRWGRVGDVQPEGPAVPVSASAVTTVQLVGEAAQQWK